MGLQGVESEWSTVTEKNRNLHEVAAFHESGHIVMAYLKGYRCNYVELSEEDPGNGVSMMDYGADLELADAIINSKVSARIFNELPKKDRARGCGTAQTLVEIFLAGSCAETIHQHKRIYKRKVEIDFSLSDIQGVDRTDYFLTLLSIESPENYIQDLVVQTFQFLLKDEIWQAVDELSNRVLASSELKLRRREIESVLKKHRYFSAEIAQVSA